MLTFDQLKQICRDDWGMKVGFVGGGNFTWDFIYQILTSYSLIYLAYPISPTLAHAVVVYGIGGLDSGKYTIFVMDPIYAYLQSDLTVYQDKRALLVGFSDPQDVIDIPGSVYR